MAQRKKRAPRPSPGGPGGMAALRRAQEKLKAMGVKLYKAAPEPKPVAAKAPVAPPPKVSADKKAPTGRPAAKPAKAAARKPPKRRR